LIHFHRCLRFKGVSGFVVLKLNLRFVFTKGKRLFFFRKKEPKTSGRSDSPLTPNGQGRVLRRLGGVCGGCPCTHPFHGVMGWGCDLNFTPTRKGEVKNCGVIVEVGLAFAPIPTREGEVKAIGENHRCWCYRKTKLLSGEAAISLPLRGRWHFCLQK
jgi:hypothetical protein